MATIGQALTAPEAGWGRLDDSDQNISYIGVWATLTNGSMWNGSQHQSTDITSKIRFNFTGPKLRILTSVNSDRPATQTISIDNILYTYSEYHASPLYQILIFDIENLSNNEHYVEISRSLSGYITLDAIDIDTAGELKPYSPISAPTNLTATAGDSQVTLSWTEVTAATGYNVERSITAGGPYTTVGSNVSGISYVDNTVTNGTAYYYVVTALNGIHESGPSNETSAMPVASAKALLRVTMIDSSEREYRLTTVKIDDFINWYTRTIGTGISCYTFNDTIDDSREYLSFEKIISFKVVSLKD